MNLPSKRLDQAVQAFSQLPGIGQKTALRLVLYLLKKDNTQVNQFAAAFDKLKEEIKYCNTCHNISDTEVCHICANSRRNRAELCVVEDIRDIIAIENTQQYNGLYHVLGGLISPMDGVGPETLLIQALIKRLDPEVVQEVILALTPSVEGDTTSLYLARLLRPFCKVTRIAYGLPMGSELEFADEITLARALEGRRTFE